MKEKQGHEICKVAELPVGERVIVEINGRSIGVFNVEGEFYALRNLCPHEGAELCKGTVTGMNLPSEVGEYNWVREGEILRCPWHAWEFDIKTGKSIFNPHKVRVACYDVEVEGAEEKAVESFKVGVNDDEMVVVYV